MSLKSCSTIAILVASCGGTAWAAGIERTADSSRILFEEGRYAEFSLGYLAPDLEDPTSGSDSSLFNSRIGFGAAYKADINDQLSYSIIFSTPWGVDTEYPNGGFYEGVQATLDSYSLTGILAYDVTPEIKLYGGLRGQSLEAQADIPIVADYAVETDRDFGFGYLVGAAYQRPEIGLRVSLTYYSKIDHTLDATESSLLAPTGVSSEIDVSTPQALHLEAQTGIMEDTLLFGSIRWVDWSEFIIEPPNYPLGTLVDYEEDWITYMIGVGRKFNDTWSGSLQYAWEPASDTVLTTLGPVDGRKTLTAGLVYSQDNWKITGGLSYSKLGDATNFVGTEFEDGTAFAAGLRFGINL
jgi:long-chain fatty acid transport protein